MRVAPGDRSRQIGILFLRKLGQPEIRELGVATLRDEDVRRLDIAVEDTGGVSDGEPVGDTREELDDLPPRATLASDPPLERAAVDVLRDQVLPACHFARVVYGQDMGMIQRRGHLRLALKSPASRSIRERIGEELDRHGTIQFDVEGAKHNAHTAVPECRLQPIRADRCPHSHGQRIALDVIGGRVCVRLGHVDLSSAGVPRRWSVGYPRTVKDDGQSIELRARRLRRWGVA